MDPQILEDADEILHWLNTHSVRVSDGVPVSHLRQMWKRSERKPERLTAAMEWLVLNRLVDSTDGLDPLHIRFTAKGYLHLVTAMDEARTSDTPVASAAPAPGPTAKGMAAEAADDAPTSAPNALPVEQAEAVEKAIAAAAPVATPAPSPEPKPAPPQPLAAMVAAAAPAIARAEPQSTDAERPSQRHRLLEDDSDESPTRYLTHGQKPSALDLRNQILYVFRDLRLQAGESLIAMTLARYWQEMGLRNGDLRTALDVLIRDGFIAHAIRRYENHWVLTAEGAEYAYASPTPVALLSRAPALKSLPKRYKPQGLLDQVAGMIPTGEAMSFSALEARWPGEADDLLFSLDVLHKRGLLLLSDSAEGLSIRRK